MFGDDKRRFGVVEVLPIVPVNACFTFSNRSVALGVTGEPLRSPMFFKNTKARGRIYG